MTEHAFTADAREANGLYDESIGCLVRVVDPQPRSQRVSYGCRGGKGFGFFFGETFVPDPFGDRLWVQETWFAYTGHGCIISSCPVTPTSCELGYKAAMKDDFDASWRAADDMPRWATRTLLDVTDVRVVRLPDVTEDDAIAAGIHVLPLQDADDPSAWWESAPGQHQARTPGEAFRKMYAAKVIGDVVNPWLLLATVAKVDA